MLGRPNCIVPVFIKSWPGAWLKASVTIDFTTVMSSDHLGQCAAAVPRARCRLCPYLANLNFGPISFEFGIDERRAIALQKFRRRQRAIELRQLRLVVEQLQVAGRAGHEEKDHALGLGSELRLLGRERIRRVVSAYPRSASSCANAMDPSPTPHWRRNQRRETSLGLRPR